ncbi:putative protein 2C [Vibrio phage vB_VpS_PG07]|uniref:Uncharacterized protein n=1 Tax=Vibrio phage vB_VpS_PG07 TaxID=2301664 RepID=A0A385E751_9CAUD|nr:putative protein 2C [Vibrio phage vB_VpS_PG07]AXQ66682.1 putative protein 2C [Vibrio phage vB_VpS_PG07]
MEMLKPDMSKAELQHVLAILLGNGISAEELKPLTVPILNKMLTALETNAKAFNALEDKYRELLQASTYKPIAPKTHRNRGAENRAMAKELRKLKSNK